MVYVECYPIIILDIFAKVFFDLFLTDGKSTVYVIYDRCYCHTVCNH